METRASYIMVGAFVLSILASLMIFAAWLTQSSFEEEEQLYHIYFSGSVSGLQTGSVVRYQGISIGKVNKLEIDPKNVERILVTVSIPQNIEIKEDAKASLQLLGLTGGAYIQISGATKEAKTLRPVGDQIPVIQSTDSSLGSLIEKAPELMDKLLAAGDAANEILSDQNVASITTFITNMSGLSEELKVSSQEFRETVENARKSTEQIQQLIQNFDERGQLLTEKGAVVLDQANSTLLTIEKDVDQVAAEVAKTTDNLKKMTDSFASAADQMDKMIKENREPVRDFTGSGLYEFSFLIVELRDLANSLTRITTQIERNPTYFIFGKQGGIEPVETK